MTFARQGIQARASAWIVTIARIVDGTIREGWNCFDFVTMCQQLGTMPPMPAA